MTTSQYIPGVAELGRKNQAGGYVGIDGSGDVIGTFAQRVDTEANLSSIVLANGELAYASDTHSVFIGDGETAGGLFLWQQWQLASKSYASGTIVTPPLAAARTTATSVIIPKVKGATYQIEIKADLGNDSTNTSNFAVNIAVGPVSKVTASWGQRHTIKTTWYDGSSIASLAIESGLQQGFGLSDMIEGVIVPLLNPSNLSRSGAFLWSEFTVRTATSDSAFSPISLTLVPRAGASSPATGTILATHRRIA